MACPRPVFQLQVCIADALWLVSTGVPVVRMIREFVHGKQETEVGVVLLGGRDRLDLLEDLDDGVDGGVGGGDGRLALDAQQLDELGPEDGEGEPLGVERGQRGQRLDELDGVLPLAVQDELPQEEEVVAVAPVDHARLPLECHLRAMSMSFNWLQ